MKKVFKASHILVSNEYEALDILRKLNEGKSFEEMSKKFSKCSSAAKGGSLGEIPFGKADSDFEEAILSLIPGEMTKKPVRTKFGYHIIKREA